MIGNGRPKPKTRGIGFFKKIFARKKSAVKNTVTSEQALALQALRVPAFAEACRANGIRGPAGYFTKNYEMLTEKNPVVGGKRVLDRELEARDKELKKGNNFNEALFYANLIAKLMAKPKSKQ